MQDVALERSSSEVISRILEFIKEKRPSKEALQKFKHHLAQELRLRHVPSDIEVLLSIPQDEVAVYKPFLMTKPVRTQSGVSPIAIMSWPYPCKHGACTMCPSLTSKGVPQSYTGKEPSTRRGIRNNFDPFLSIWNRLEQYVVTGHNFDKIEIIIQGGTFLSFPIEYQDDYILHIYKALNDFSRLFFKDGEFNFDQFKEFFELPGRLGDEARTERIHKRALEIKYQSPSSLDAEIEYNDLYSHIKCVGLTIETKPDWGFKDQGDRMLRYGCTRVELGIQSVYEDVITLINRGHTIADTIRSIRELRDLGFKLNFHYMPGLPGVKDRKQDLAGMRQLFEDENYRPDMLKIYPCLVMKESKLFADWKAGRFTPITTKDAADIIVEFKRVVPEYCRIMRVQRDIPTYVTEAGVDRTNLRQYVEMLQKERGVVCRCIRCREVKGQKLMSPVEIVVREYTASGGKEFFVSAESDDRVVGFVRLRFPSESLRVEIPDGAALIRELHVFGAAVRIGDEGEASQHRGIGRALMERAESIAKEGGKCKMVVISGVGVRGYYRKLGYSLEGPYMVKGL